MIYDNYNYKLMGCINQLITGGWHNVGWEIGKFQRQKLWTALGIEVYIMW